MHTLSDSKIVFLYIFSGEILTQVDQENVMVNFMCQFDQATEYPDIWSNNILGVSVRVFWMRLTFELVGTIKQIALSDVNRPHLVN